MRNLFLFLEIDFTRTETILEILLRHMCMPKKSTEEEFVVSGKAVVKKMKAILKEGNARKIILKNEKGNTIFEVPLTFAVIGTVIAPILAAVGAVAALATECTITVVKKA